MWCFVHFDVEMCFAPQRRTLFEHLETSKSAPNPIVFYTFDSGMCFAPQRRALFFDISASKSGPSMWCFYILTWKCASHPNGVHFLDISTTKMGPILRCFAHLSSKCASRHNGVQFFISHLASWLGSRRFSEPTFRPSRSHKPLGKKNTVFRDFPTFSRTWIFFLLRLSLF